MYWGDTLARCLLIIAIVIGIGAMTKLWGDSYEAVSRQEPVLITVPSPTTLSDVEIFSQISKVNRNWENLIACPVYNSLITTNTPKPRAALIVAKSLTRDDPILPAVNRTKQLIKENC